MKKLFALVLVLILIVSMCACNNTQLPNDDNKQSQSQGNQQTPNNDEPADKKYKLTVIDYWDYLRKPLDEYYEAGEEVEVTLAFLSGPAVGIELNGDYIGENADTKYDGVYPIITFTMPAKDSVLYTTQNGNTIPLSTASNEQPNQWGITLRTGNVTANGLTIVCNHSGGENVAELNTGSYYVIQKLEETSWVDVEYLQQEYELTWTSEAWIIQKEGTTLWDVNWEWLYGKLSAGEYRIGKEITNFRGTGDYDKEMVYAGFIIN